jgi:hypothetical protein
MRPGVSFAGTLPPKGFAALVAGAFCPAEYVCARHITDAQIRVLANSARGDAPA